MQGASLKSCACVLVTSTGLAACVPVFIARRMCVTLL